MVVAGILSGRLLSRRLGLVFIVVAASVAAVASPS
jgi:hypothetical protein